MNLATIPTVFRSIPVVARELRATPEALEGIYEAARLGLKGDSLALAAGRLPSEYRRLCQMDPIAELAEQKGRADAELAVSRTVYSAAEGGDAKAALSVLQHQFGWTARSEVSVDVWRAWLTEPFADLGRERAARAALWHRLHDHVVHRAQGIWGPLR